MRFEEFLAARLPALLRYAAVLTGDPYRAQDVVQDALVKAERRWRRIRDLDAPEAYLKRMITNEYLSWRRRRQASETPMAHEVLALLGGRTDDPGVLHGDLDELRRGVAALPAQQRAALALRYYEDLAYPEIAAMLGCAEGTARSYVSRALTALRVDLAPSAQEAR